VQRIVETLRNLSGLSPDEITLVALGLAVVACLLLTWGLYRWMRRLLRAWVQPTRTSVDDQLLPHVESSLLPLVAFGVVYVLVVLGVAAQRSLGDVFAGLQLALTQPVRQA
jgi:hypothetical protein